MPDAGRLTEDLVAHAGPLPAPLYPPPPWELPRARVLKVLFETDKEPVLQWLPPKLTRSSPPYAAITVEHYPESPIGPFAVATQYIGCRAGFFQRAFALQTVVNTPAALAALRETWGYPAILGEVSLRLWKNGKASASVVQDRRLLTEIDLLDPVPIDNDAVRLDPTLTLRLVPSVQEGVRHDLIQLVQIDPESEVKSAARGRGVISYADGSPWAVLPNRNMISAVSCTLDTELPLARFVMPY